MLTTSRRQMVWHCWTSANLVNPSQGLFLKPHFSKISPKSKCGVFWFLLWGGKIWGRKKGAKEQLLARCNF